MEFMFLDSGDVLIFDENRIYIVSEAVFVGFYQGQNQPHVLSHIHGFGLLFPWGDRYRVGFYLLSRMDYDFKTQSDALGFMKRMFRFLIETQHLRKHEYWQHQAVRKYVYEQEQRIVNGKIHEPLPSFDLD